MGTSYYDILDVPKEAKENEIKKAYVLKLRQYPNEKFPEEFKAIRKAYEILSNSKSRKEYDTMSIYGEEIKQLQAAALNALDNEEFEEAIQCYKKILMIEPSLLNIRNEYALALIYNGQQDKAIKQLDKLIAQEPDNATYLYNLGGAYESKGDDQEAISFYKKASEKDPNDINIVYKLSDVYTKLKDYTNARKVINEALSRNSNEGFRQFMYLFRHLQIDVFSKDSNAIRRTLDRIENLLEEYPEEKSYVANEFGKFAVELFDYKQFEWAYYLTEKGIELDPDHSQLLLLHEDTKNNKLLYGEFEQLEKDEKVVKPLRYNLFLYLFGNEFSEEELNNSLDNMFKNIELSCMYEPDETLNSLKRMNIKYPNLYKLREDLFKDVRKMSEDYKMRNDQYESMKNDSVIVNSFKRLVALYLADLEEEERRDYFEDIMEEMSYEQASSVKMSINRLQSTYPKLFDLNPDFLLDIKTKLNESTQANSYSPNTNRTENTSYASNNPSSTSSSCFVATAAFGSPLTAELDYLRFWRDNYLRKNSLGKWFIGFYYKVGPSLAKPVGKSPLLKRLFQRIIYKIIYYIDKKHDLINQFHRQTGPAQKKVK